MDLLELKKNGLLLWKVKKEKKEIRVIVVEAQVYLNMFIQK